jgi:hypothetical protein
MRILWLIIPGFVVGWLVIDRMRRPFSDDDKLLRRWLAEQPVTAVAACTIVGSIVVWALLMILGIW